MISRARFLGLTLYAVCTIFWMRVAMTEIELDRAFLGAHLWLPDLPYAPRIVGNLVILAVVAYPWTQGLRRRRMILERGLRFVWLPICIATLPIALMLLAAFAVGSLGDASLNAAILAACGGLNLAAIGTALILLADSLGPDPVPVEDHFS